MTKLKYERKNEKDSGRSNKMTPSCKWTILYGNVYLASFGTKFITEHQLAS